MRFKKLLLREEEIDSFVEDCYYFLSENEAPLNYDFFLKRGSKSNYSGLTKKASRQRKGVYSPDLYFFHNKFKPSSFPSRKDLIPTYGKYVVEDVFQEDSYEVYLIFPIGNNYKMCYHPEVSDFNFNPLLSDYVVRNVSCYNNFANEMGILFSKLEQSDNFDIPQRYNRAKNWSSDPNCSVSVEIIEEIYPQLMEFLNTYSWDELDGYIDLYYMNYKNKRNLKKNIEVLLWGYKNYFDEYFGGSKQTDRLEDPMIESEVGLYAPKGFYYLPENQKNILYDALEKV